MIKTLPKEVLDLFPMWEYQCPKCQTYVEPNVLHCPKCLAPFDALSWRVPPRFLRNHEAMSKYAHEVLAPKLRTKQRELLFRYFTTIWSEGWETGDFSNCTGTATDGNGFTPVVETANPHHGTYNCKCAKPAGGYGTSAVYKNFAAADVAYSQFYVKLSAMPPTGEQVSLCQVRNDWPNSNFAQIYNDAGSLKWRLGVRIAGVEHFVSEASASNPTIDTWYCVKVLRDVTSSIGKLWVDAVLKATDTGYTYSGTNYYLFIHVSTNSYGVTGYFDCVVVADTDIDPEVSEGVKLDGKTLNVLSFGEDARAVMSQWDAWVDGAYKRKVKVLGISRSWMLDCVENDVGWTNSQAKSFQETAAAGFTVTFSITSEVRVINTTVYIIDVGIQVADLAGKNVRHFTLTLQET